MVVGCWGYIKWWCLKGCANNAKDECHNTHMAVSENRVYLRGMAILKANMTINQWTINQGAQFSDEPLRARKLDYIPKLGDGHQAMGNRDFFSQSLGIRL